MCVPACECMHLHARACICMCVCMCMCISVHAVVHLHGGGWLRMLQITQYTDIWAPTPLWRTGGGWRRMAQNVANNTICGHLAI